MPGLTPTYQWPYPIATDPLDDAVSVIPQQLANAIESTVLGNLGLAAPLQWHTIGGAGEPAFQAGWAAFGAPLRVPQYRKIGTIVYLRGVLSSVTAHAAQSTVWTLPAGFRPTVQEAFGGTGGSGDTRVDVLPTGVVQVVPALAAGGFVSLSGMFWHTD